jgi:hypothetical protein
LCCSLRVNLFNFIIILRNNNAKLQFYKTGKSAKYDPTLYGVCPKIKPGTGDLFFQATQQMVPYGGQAKLNACTRDKGDVK